MTLRILWELASAGGPLTFRGLQHAAQTNPSVLNNRLKELRNAQIIEHGGRGYQLSAMGKSLLAIILPLHLWADEWASLHKRNRAMPSRGKGNA